MLNGTFGALRRSRGSRGRFMFSEVSAAAGPEVVAAPEGPARNPASGRDQLALLGDLGRVLSLVSFLGLRSLSASRDRPEQPSGEQCAGEA